MNLSPKAKAVAAFVVGLLGAIATVVQAAITDGTITGNEWSKIGIVAVTWLVSTGAVYRVPNTPAVPEGTRVASRTPTR